MSSNPRAIGYVLLEAPSYCSVALRFQFELSGLESKARTILKGLGFKESTTIHKSYTSLSGGWRMRCHLAAVLYQSSNADIVILDEPTQLS